MKIVCDSELVVVNWHWAFECGTADRVEIDVQQSRVCSITFLHIIFILYSVLQTQAHRWRRNHKIVRIFIASSVSLRSLLVVGCCWLVVLLCFVFLPHLVCESQELSSSPNET